MDNIRRVALALIAVLLVSYAADYAAARIRQPLGSVEVQIMWAVKQKNHRVDYELGDVETRPCVHSLLPHMGYEPCWYLTRHRNQTVTVGALSAPPVFVAGR